VWKQLCWLVTVVNAVLLVEQWWSEGQSIVVWPWQLFFVYLGRVETKEGKKSNPINDNGQVFLYVRMRVVSANNTTRISGGLAPVYRIYSCFLFDCFKVNINTWSSTYKTNGNFYVFEIFLHSIICSLLISECYKMISRSRVSIPVPHIRALYHLSYTWFMERSISLWSYWLTTLVPFKIELLFRLRKSKNQIRKTVRGIFLFRSRSTDFIFVLAVDFHLFMGSFHTMYCHQSENHRQWPIFLDLQLDDLSSRRNLIFTENHSLHCA
jgi:hypothetical protein